MVISFLNKDYEIQSWNKQGEITKIEGMLTIAFLVIYLCSHIDNRKQLYLIMKIPYLVKMPTKKEMKSSRIFQPFDINEYRVLKMEIPSLYKKIKQLESENNELKEKLEEVGKQIERVLKQYQKEKEEVDKLKIENQTLKEKLGIIDSEWQFIRDLATRINPITKEHEYFNFPLGFQEDRVEHLHYALDEHYNEIIDIYKFDYYVGDFVKDRKYDSYTMSKSLYDYLCKKNREEKQQYEQEKQQREKKNLDSVEKIRKHLEDNQIQIYGLEYLNTAIQFILDNRGKTFETKLFKGKCNIDSRTTVNDYLKMFQDAKIIENVRKGFWKVIIK